MKTNMRTVRFTTRWIAAVVLATCLGNTNVMAQTSLGEAQATLLHAQASALSDADAVSFDARYSTLPCTTRC